MPLFKAFGELKQKRRRREEDNLSDEFWLESEDVRERESESFPVRMSDNVGFVNECESRTEIDQEGERMETVRALKDLLSLIREWAVKHNITRQAVSDLLDILKPYHAELPRSYKTLLRTPRNLEICEVAGGQFLYLGLKSSLTSIINSLENKGEELTIDLTLNSDGAPIFSNSREIGCIWPLLCYSHTLQSSIFPIAIFCGRSKPDNFNEILKDFVNEFLELRENFIVDGVRINLYIRAFILDAPAKSAICGICGHTGFKACPKCTEIGFSMSHRTVFSNLNCSKRTNASFRAKSDEGHHNSVTVLENIEDLDMVDDIPNDYLHNVLLGVNKRTLEAWFGSKRNNAKYGHQVKSQINLKIEIAIKSQPSDFHRNIRHIEKFTIFKGTEFRHLLFYLGPFIFDGTISRADYKIFMYLHIAMSILKCEDLCVKYNSIAKNLINYFVSEFTEEFGQQYLTYNFHVITHLPDDCLKYGCVDNFSAFRFENFLKELKSYVKSPYRPLHQIYNRYSEKLENVGLKCKSVNVEYMIEKPIGLNKFSKLLINGAKLETNGRDCYIQLKCINRIIRVEYFEKEMNEIYLHGFEFTKVSNIYELPIHSMDIYEYQVSTVHTKPCRVNVADILRKFYVIHKSDEVSLFFPLSVIPAMH